MAASPGEQRGRWRPSRSSKLLSAFRAAARSFLDLTAVHPSPSPEEETRGEGDGITTMDLRRLPPRWSGAGLSVRADATVEPDPHGEGPADARIHGDGAAGISGTWDGPLDAARISPFSGVLQARLTVSEAGAPAWE